MCAALCLKYTSNASVPPVCNEKCLGSYTSKPYVLYFKLEKAIHLLAHFQTHNSLAVVNNRWKFPSLYQPKKLTLLCITLCTAPLFVPVPPIREAPGTSETHRKLLKKSLSFFQSITHPVVHHPLHRSSLCACATLKVCAGSSLAAVCTAQPVHK